MKNYMGLILIFFCMYTAGNVYADSMDDVEIHGFISQGYLKTSKNETLQDSKDGTFQLNEMGINFNKMVSNGLKIGSQFFARDYGKYGNDEITLDWAYADYRHNNLLGMRIGILKIPIGLYNEIRDVDAIRTFILMPNGTYPELHRDIYTGLKGIGLYGELPGNIAYQCQYGIIDDLDSDTSVSDSFENIVEKTVISSIRNQMSALPEQTVDALTSQVTATVPKIKFDSAISASVQWYPSFLDGFRLGASHYRQAFDVYCSYYEPLSGGGSGILEFDCISFSVASIQYVFGPAILSSEYGLLHIGPKEDISNDTESLYVSISYELSDLFQISSYYSIEYENKDDKKGDSYKKEGLPDYYAWTKDFCLSTRVDFNDYWSLKLEGHFMDGGAAIANKNINDTIAQDWVIYVGKISYNF